MAEHKPESTREILSQIEEAPWFCAVGQAERQDESREALMEYLVHCGAARPEVRWAADWEEARAIARGLDHGTALWQPEETRRARAMDLVHTAQRDSVLRQALNRLSEIGYERVRPGVEDEELARVASGAALWTASEALTWAAVGDLLAPESNPFLPKLRIFQLGHWPLGFYRDAFVIL